MGGYYILVCKYVMEGLKIEAIYVLEVVLIINVGCVISNTRSERKDRKKSDRYFYKRNDK
jgi:hypothetical protein